VTQVPTTFGGGVPRQAGPHGDAAAPATPPTTASRLGGRKGLLAAVAGVVLLAVAGGGGYVLLSGSSDPQPVAAPAGTATRSPAAATKSPTHAPTPTVAKATPHATFDPFYGDGSITSASGAGSTGTTAPTGSGTGTATSTATSTATTTSTATPSPTAKAAVYVSLVGWMSGPMADLWINAKHQPLSVGSSADGVKLVSQLPPDTTGQVCAKIVSTTNVKLTATVCPGTSVALG
jgi:hypothetical protein